MPVCPRSVVVALLAVVCAAGSARAQAQEEPIVIGKVVRLQSKVLGEERRLLIAVPEDYESSTVKYPVLYVLDGDTTALAEAYHWVHSGSGIPPMIVVGVANTNRNRDMFPSDKPGGARSFLEFFTSELIPYIGSHYRAESFRAIYGASNAGLFVVYAMLEQPSAFAAYVASSPTVLWRPEIMTAKAMSAMRPKPSSSSHLFIVYGDKEWPELRDALGTYLPVLESTCPDALRMGVRFLPDETHVPAASLLLGLRFVFDGFEYPDERVEKEGLAALKAFYAAYSKKIGYQVAPPPGALSRVGQQLMRRKQLGEAIEAFELAGQIYPGSWSTQVFLAVAHFRNGNMDAARRHYLAARAHKDLETPPFPEWRTMTERFR